MTERILPARSTTGVHNINSEEVKRISFPLAPLPEQRRIVNAQLAEGLAEIDAGNVRGPFATHKEFIASLHEEAKKLNRKKTKRSA